jgi:hypothetical protein
MGDAEWCFAFLFVADRSWVGERDDDRTLRPRKQVMGIRARERAICLSMHQVLHGPMAPRTDEIVQSRDGVVEGLK